MEVGCSLDGLTLSSLSSGAAEDEGRGTSPSLAPLLARLGRDERLGWTTSRSRTDDTDRRHTLAIPRYACARASRGKNAFAH